jgi:hypothetical protein
MSADASGVELPGRPSCRTVAPPDLCDIDAPVSFNPVQRNCHKRHNWHKRSANDCRHVGVIAGKLGGQNRGKKFVSLGRSAATHLPNLSPPAPNKFLTRKEAEAHKQTALAAIQVLEIGDVLKFFYERAMPRDRQIADMAEAGHPAELKADKEWLQKLVQLAQGLRRRSDDVNGPVRTGHAQARPGSVRRGDEDHAQTLAD